MLSAQCKLRQELTVLRKGLAKNLLNFFIIQKQLDLTFFQSVVIFKLEKTVLIGWLIKCKKNRNENMWRNNEECKKKLVKKLKQHNSWQMIEGNVEKSRIGIIILKNGFQLNGKKGAINPKVRISKSSVKAKTNQRFSS